MSERELPPLPTTHLHYDGVPYYSISVVRELLAAERAKVLAELKPAGYVAAWRWNKPEIAARYGGRFFYPSRITTEHQAKITRDIWAKEHPVEGIDFDVVALCEIPKDPQS